MRHTQRGDKYKEETHTERGTNGEETHTKRGSKDIHGEETYKKRGSEDIYGDGTHTKRRHTWSGDIHREVTHME